MYPYELGELSPRDAGKLSAHRLSATCSTAALQRRLAEAKSQRRGWLCFVLLRRRSYLDGLIDGFEHELALRGSEAHEH